MRILPTRKLLLLLLVPVAVMVLWPGRTGLTIGLAMDFAAVFMFLFDLLISPAPQSIQVERVLPPFLSLGGDNSIGWDIRNNSRFTIRFDLTEDIPDTFQREQAVTSGRILPQSRASLRYIVRPTRRGLHEFKNIHLRCTTLLGLAVRQRRITAGQAVKVYPNVANLSRYELALHRQQRMAWGLQTVQQRGSGRQFESLRDYVPGDDIIDVAWKATARRGRLTTRNYEAERSQNILVVIDCGRLMTTEVDGISRLDYAINASLLLTYVAAKQGDSIGMLAFGDNIKAYAPPSRGKGAIRRMNETLYRLEPSLTESDYDRACRFLALRYRKRSLIVIFTDVIDKEASSVLLAHAARFARQHLPLCVTMRNLEVESLAHAQPRETVDCYTKVVALQSLERRAEALARMRRSGVDVLDVEPRILTPNLINRYLHFKQRHRL